MRYSGMSDMATAERKRQIRASIREGKPAQAIADDHGLTVRYVRLIAQQAGLSGPVGRPAAWPDCPPDQLEHFHKLRRILGARRARWEIYKELGI